MSLSDLIVKEAEVNEEVLKKILSDLVRFTEQGKILMKNEFRKLSSREKVLTYLAAKKACSLLFEDSDLAADNSELRSELNIPGGTLRPRIKELRDEGLVITKKAKHSITDSGVYQLSQRKEDRDE